MKKRESNQVRKLAYIMPVTQVMPAEPASMTCATVTPNPGGSGNSSWDNDEGHEGGSIGFGDESSVAPAKWGAWEDEEEE